MNPAHIPNLISLLRVFLVWPVVSSLLNGDTLQTLLLYTIAGLSDGLDGFIAKRFGYVSRLGSILDPLADKLLLVSTFSTLAWLGLVPLYLVLVIIARDVLILCGAAVFYWLIGRYDLAPTLISKVNTFFQLSLGLLVVVSRVIDIPQGLLEVAFEIVLMTTVLSGANYVWVWGRRAYLVLYRRRGH